jgi:hypothetical protein
LILEFNSITNSTYVNEGIEALRLAKEFQDKKSLRKNFEINKHSKSSRNNCWNQINKRYLTNPNGDLNRVLIKLIDYEDIKLNKELMFYHYLQEELIFKKTLVNFIYPKLRVDNEYVVKSEDVLFFIGDYLDYASSTMKKTARSIVKALVDFEIAEVEENKVKVKTYRPELLSVVYAFYSEYAAGVEEAKNFNILNPSVEHIKEKAEFYKLFLMQPAIVEDYLQRAWKEDYLGYEPRGGLNQYVLKYKSLNSFVSMLL